MWEFPKVTGLLFSGPYNKDPASWGTILGSPIFGNPHVSPGALNPSTLTLNSEPEALISEL